MGRVPYRELLTDGGTHVTNIIVVFPKIEDAKSIKNVLVRNGFSAMAACTTGAQAIGLAEDYTNGIVICGYKLIDMPNFWIVFPRGCRCCSWLPTLTSVR